MNAQTSPETTDKRVQAVIDRLRGEVWYEDTRYHSKDPSNLLYVVIEGDTVTHVNGYGHRALEGTRAYWFANVNSYVRLAHPPKFCAPLGPLRQST